MKTGLSPISSSALEAYEMREAGREPASAFYARISEYTAAFSGDDADLDVVINENRKPHLGIDL